LIEMAQKPKNARMRFAANVERLRRQRGYSLDQLAERSQMGKTELEAILRGETEAHVDSVYRLAGSLQVSPGKLYEGVAWIPDGEGGGEYRIDDRSDD
jgi:transcriptional regulator with XRE-family HTH domain